MMPTCSTCFLCVVVQWVFDVCTLLLCCDRSAERGAEVHRYLVEVRSRPFPDEGRERQVPRPPCFQAAEGVNAVGATALFVSWLSPTTKGRLNTARLEAAGTALLDVPILFAFLTFFAQHFFCIVKFVAVFSRLDFCHVRR